MKAHIHDNTEKLKAEAAASQERRRREMRDTARNWANKKEEIEARVKTRSLLMVQQYTNARKRIAFQQATKQAREALAKQGVKHPEQFVDSDEEVLQEKRAKAKAPQVKPEAVSSALVPA